MNIIKTFVKRPVTTTMVILIFLSFGILSFTNLQIDMMPKMDMPIALVSTTYSGAGSEEIETLITEPLEGVLGTVPGISSITSSSSNGSSMVMLEFEDGTDLDQAAIDMREKVDMIKGALPEEASDPMVLKIDINQLSGSTIIGVKSPNGNLTELQNLVDTKIINRLERQPGVASVSAGGGTENEIQVTLNQEALRGYGISESTVIQMLYAENTNTPTGTVQQGNQELSLRVQGQFEDLDDIRNIPLYTSTGQTVFLSDVATVEEVVAERSSYSYIDGKPAITLTVQKQSTANTVDVSNALKKEMAKIQTEYPNIEIVSVYDPAEYINASISNVATSALVGGFLAIIILFIFLKDVRTTLIVAVAIPISIIMTFALMYATGMTINIMSLGGLTLGVGMLVDNSIVVIESIYRKLEEGESRFNAAIDGAQEVAMSVIASTLTTIVVFLPITFTGGLSAQIFNQLSFTISFSLISSLFSSLTFVPMASALFLITEEEKLNVGIIYRILTKFNNGFNKFQEKYKNLLGKALSHRKSVLAIVVAFLILTSISITTIGAVFMPSSDQGMLTVSVDMPSGTVIEDVLDKATEVSAVINEVPEVASSTLTVGSDGSAMSALSGSNGASFWVDLVPKSERERSAKEVEVDLNNQLKVISGCKVTVTADQGSMGSYGSTGVSITIKGDDLDTLESIVNDFSGMLSSIDGVTKVESSIEESAPQANIVIDRQKAAGYGIQAASVASVVSTQVSGSAPTTLKGDGTELDINISGDVDAYQYVDDIKNILIPTSYGTSVPLYEIADFTITYPPTTIARENQQRYVTVTATTDGTSSSEITKAFNKQMETYIMPANYTWAYGGSQEQMQETFGSMLLALVMAILLVYMVMAAEFESFLYPFIVLFSIPIAISGGIFGLALVGEPISITSFLGMIMLAGLVINSAIIIIDYTNLHVRNKGMTPKEALMISGPVRLRPIVMSVATTTLGLIPMAVSQAEGAEMMSGLAVFVIFGLLFSTLVTLFFIPVVYLTLTTKSMERAERKEEKRLAKIEKYNKIKSEQNNGIAIQKQEVKSIEKTEDTPIDTIVEEIEKTEEAEESKSE